MIFKMFGIFDEKAKAYKPPFFLPEEGQAVRAFGDAANNKELDVGRHPSDFSLWCLGTFDDNSGEVVVPKKPDLVAQASQLVVVSTQDTEVPASPLKEVG